MLTLFVWIQDYKMLSRSRLWDTIIMLYNSAVIDKASKQEIINVRSLRLYIQTKSSSDVDGLQLF